MRDKKDACFGQPYPEQASYLCGMVQTADKQCCQSCGMPLCFDPEINLHLDIYDKYKDAVKE